MIAIKYILFLSFFLVCIALCAEKNNFPTIIFDKITIHGNSSINEFSLFIPDNINPANETLIESCNNNLIEFKIPVNSFKSDICFIENDFRKMIKENSYPNVKLSFNKEELCDIDSLDSSKKFETFISIAGVTKKFHVMVDNVIIAQSSKLVNGKVEILLSEFNLKPLSKIFGLIKVDDKVVIDFRLILSLKRT